MESDSQKRRRGRPRGRLTHDVEAQMTAMHLWGDRQRSHRARTNRMYEQDAMAAIGMGEDPTFTWLLARTPDGQSFTTWRHTILAELGRCGNAETIRMLATHLCALQPSTRKAIARLRAIRRGSERPGTADQLYAELIGCVNAFFERYPTTDWQEVERAVLRTLGDVRASKDGAAG